MDEHFALIDANCARWAATPRGVRPWPCVRGASWVSMDVLPAELADQNFASSQIAGSGRRMPPKRKRQAKEVCRQRPLGAVGPARGLGKAGAGEQFRLQLARRTGTTGDQIPAPAAMSLVGLKVLGAGGVVADQ